jgi:hypothetical protein
MTMPIWSWEINFPPFAQWFETTYSPLYIGSELWKLYIKNLQWCQAWGQKISYEQVFFNYNFFYEKNVTNLLLLLLLVLQWSFQSVLTRD